MAQATIETFEFCETYIDQAYAALKQRFWFSNFRCGAQIETMRKQFSVRMNKPVAKIEFSETVYAFFQTYVMNSDSLIFKHPVIYLCLFRSFL